MVEQVHSREQSVPTLFQVLEQHGCPLPPQETVIVRHKDHRYNVPSLMRRGLFHYYQAYQSRPRFRRYRYVLAFVGEDAGLARLIGLYAVHGEVAAASIQLPAGCPPDWPSENGFFYHLVKLDDLEPLRGRLVIDWGPGKLAWVQRLRDRQVVAIEDSPWPHSGPATLLRPHEP